MKQQLFTLKTLHLLDDGELAAAFDEQLAGLVKDCLARPKIEKERTLKLEVKVEPYVKTDGTCDDVVVKCFTSSKAPTRPITPYRMNSTVNGGLKFAPDSPDSPDQKSLGLED
jgi:hypothetical protein